MDLRVGSPTYGKHQAVKLDALRGGNCTYLKVLHGFSVLEDGTKVAYKCTEYYAPDYEQSIKWDDADRK